MLYTVLPLKQRFKTHMPPSRYSKFSKAIKSWLSKPRRLRRLKLITTSDVLESPLSWLSDGLRLRLKVVSSQTGKFRLTGHMLPKQAAPASDLGLIPEV